MQMNSGAACSSIQLTAAGTRTERRSRHDRHFAGGQIDIDVVDSQACERRHQVLDGLDPGTGPLEAGRQAVSPTA